MLAANLLYSTISDGFVTIDSFTAQYRFLSNFYPCVVDYEGRVYPTVEHAFQAAKTLNQAEKSRVFNAIRPGDAKRLGRNVTLRPDWNRIRVGIMLELVRIKFREPALRAKLVATHPEKLVEGNHWNDTFWGVCDGVGENQLGRVLEIVRDEYMVEVKR
jgi:ribA/ribD-fused uncharacterized protein